MKLRSSNIELLRIFLIIMIISHHLIYHYLGFKNITSESFVFNKSTYFEVVLESFFSIAVDCFVFISGFFCIKFKPSRILSIVVQAFTYSVILYFVSILLGKEVFYITTFVKSLFPISTNLWWFISTYICLYFLAPFLNVGVKYIDRFEFAYILIGLFILNSVFGPIFKGFSGLGYNITNFVYIYLLGRFISQNKINLKNPRLILLICTSVLSVLGIISIYLGKNSLVFTLWAYNNPVIILSAISFFFVFHNIKLEYNRYINYLAQTVLGVYMIHDHTLIRNFID